MKYAIPLLLILTLAISTQPSALAQEMPEDTPEETRDGLLLHMSQGPEEAHRTLNPLSLGLRMHQFQPIRFFLDINAVYVVMKDAEPVTHEAFEDDSKTMVRKLLDAGVEIHICPMCMKAAGVTLDDLMDGVQPANPGTFHDFTTGRITTLDW